MTLSFHDHMSSLFKMKATPKLPMFAKSREALSSFYAKDRLVKETFGISILAEFSGGRPSKKRWVLRGAPLMPCWLPSCKAPMFCSPASHRLLGLT